MSRSDVTIGLSEIVCHFEELEDPRSTINRLHPLPSVLTISLMGVLAGADGPTGISVFVQKSWTEYRISATIRAGGKTH
ncbi:MAG: transposase family protein [Planctomycetales bacterium]|nr:transposase family protein [Planctomycetales bacterium]